MERLTPRLEAVAALVPEQARLVDIGTDHAYIPIALSGKIVHAVAADVNEGPLERAKNNIEKHELSELIETRLSNGFSDLHPGEADTAVIAGMGGVLICEILSCGGEAAESIKTFILQPMTAQDEVRRYLERSGYRITQERLAKEGDKLYTVIACVHGDMKIGREGYYHVGKALFDAADPLLPLLMEKKTTEYKKIVHGLQNASLPDEQRIKEAQFVLQELYELADMVEGRNGDGHA